MVKFNFMTVAYAVIMAVLAGLIAPAINDAVGLSGLMATFVFVAIFVMAFAYITKSKNYLWLGFFAFLALFIGNLLSDMFAITGGIMTTVVFAIVFTVLLTYFGKRAR